jgi:uncharacterized membrane protein YccC
LHYSSNSPPSREVKQGSRPRDVGFGYEFDISIEVKQLFGVFVLGLIRALLGIGRNAFRYAGITLAIVMLVARAEPAWMIAVHRFLEISVGIAVGLLLTAVWPEPEPAAA